MSMPPSGLNGQGMDEEAIIEAEIQFELDNINLDNDQFADNGDLDPDDGLINDGEMFNADLETSNEIDDYIKRIQDQTRKFEEELEECDELLQESSLQKESQGHLALIPYEDQQLLDRLACELGCSVEEYKKKILEEIEQDNFEIKDELAEFLTDEKVDVAQEGTNQSNDTLNGSLPSITDGQEIILHGEQDLKLDSEIQKAIEEGVDPSEIPVSQEMLPTSQQTNGKASGYIEIQNKLRDQLEKLEIRYEERLEKLKKEEAFRKNEEEVREKRSEEERLWKRQELEREEQKLKLERELAERKIIAETSEVEKELAEQTMKFQKEMAELEAERELQKVELEKSIEDERERQAEKKATAALKIQSNYRGYRIRRQTVPVLKEKREIRLREKEERRIKEVEEEIVAREEEKNRKEEEERLRKEEAKRKEEEFKKQKELEKQQREEEKRRKKEEEEQKKQEEKRRKEEEKQRKKEEERKRKEEEKRRKEKEEQRKKEEKRLKEEQEKQRKEEEKRRKEEEKRKKEEEKRQKEEEKKQAEEEIRLKEEKLRQEQEEKNVLTEQTKTAIDDHNIPKHNDNLTENHNDLTIQQENHNNLTLQEENHVAQSTKLTSVDRGENRNETDDSVNREKNNSNASVIRNCKENLVVSSSETQMKVTDFTNDPSRTGVVTESQKPEDKAQAGALVTGNAISSEQGEKENPREFRVTKASDDKTDRHGTLEKIQQSGHIPHPPSPRKRNKYNLESKLQPEKTEVSAEITKLDCLPDQLETLRLKFMKECQPWSKVSNEPWKLKTGLSRKPLRRPSSAKKLPLIAESVILQAASAASLQQVTTVQLRDLPGNNMSPLGQCWGLKYLSMNNCNLVAVDSLGQCKQLQYIDVKENRIEYLDLRDVGQLQYLNLSHNRLSCIHGIDNCSSLRWLDLSHNNITKLGGLDTLRRLNTLILSHNQLISAEGLGATPTLQMIDLSHNHLQEINDLEKLCLLLSLDLSSNNLLMVPELKNQVLLQELNLSDNSVSSLDGLSSVWLPLLTTLKLSQNSLSGLTSSENCLTLKTLDLGNNQLIEFDTIMKCVEGCFYLENLLLDDNPVTADLTASSSKTLQISCPRLQLMNLGTPRKQEPLKPRTSFETMCLTQSQVYRDIWAHLDTSLKNCKSQDLASLCDIHYKYCEKTFNTAVEHRYAHEYGEISVTMPTAPTTPKSGRPKSGRQKDTFISPKDMFENALRASNQPKAINGAIGANVSTRTTDTVTSLDSNPKDLFEQALQSAECVQNEKKNVISYNSANLVNGETTSHKPESLQEKRMRATVTIQAYWRGWLVRHEFAEHTRIWLAATAIQAHWRGHWVRKQLKKSSQMEKIYRDMPADRLDYLNKSATKIQAMWRGYNLRRKLLAALEYAQCNFDDDEEDEDAMMFGDDFDLDKFVSLDQNLLDDDWKPPETPDIPSHHPVLKKPPSGRAKIPPIPFNDHQPPSNPRRAWRNTESPMTDVDKISRPPSSLASTELTARTGISKKEERLTEEWGFKDTTTAHLMMQRAKKMKYNAERRNKISKLDPRQRLALFRKLEEVTHPRTVPAPQRKTLPRKEYFKARQEEIHRQDREKQEEYNVRVSRTFEWLHTQVGDHYVSDSVINKGYVDGPRYVPENLPNLQGIRRVQLTTPGSIDLQSVESVSSAGHKPRRSSASTGSSSKLPPIQSSSAPTQHVKERMSFRNPKVNQSVGWGGGKKRGSIF